MKKANDQIPEDEMLLAEAIAAAKANYLGWARGYPFLDADNNRTGPSTACKVCALGALHFAGSIDMIGGGLAPLGYLTAPNQDLRGVIHGNDREQADWETAWSDDDGESLGWAFRCFFTQDEE